jgi:hypothetical protein
LNVFGGSIANKDKFSVTVGELKFTDKAVLLTLIPVILKLQAVLQLLQVQFLIQILNQDGTNLKQVKT